MSRDLSSVLSFDLSRVLSQAVVLAAFLLFGGSLVGSAPAFAQEEVTEGASGNELQVVVGNGSDTFDLPDVQVSLSAPSWLTFDATSVDVGTIGPLGIVPARFPFSVADDAAGNEGTIEVVIEASSGDRFTGVEVPDLAIDVRVVPDSGAAIVYILDRSGSMSGAPLSNAKTSANQGITLMPEGDEVAVVSFSSAASTNYGRREITDPSVRSGARSAVSGLSASGATSIGAGLLRGCSVLGGSSKPSRNYVLLSDGAHNTPPSPAEGLACIQSLVANQAAPGPLAMSRIGTWGPTASVDTPRDRIHTIAFGRFADQELLADLAAQTGGVFLFVAGTNDPLALANLFFTIQGEISNQERLNSFESALAAPGVEAFPFTFGDDLSTGTVTLLWDDPQADLDLTLLRPDGTVIDAQTWTTEPGVDRVAGPAIEYFTVDPATTGTWTARVTAASGAASYALLFSGTSATQLDVAFDRTEYPLDENVVVRATLTDDGAPLTGATVTATVLAPTQAAAQDALRARAAHRAPGAGEATPSGRAPNASAARDGSGLTPQPVDGAKQYVSADGTLYYATSPLRLYDDGDHLDGAANDGVYGNFYAQTQNAGTYSFTVRAEATTATGAPLVREATRAVVVMPAPEAVCPGTLRIDAFDADTPGDPDTEESVDVLNDGADLAVLDGCTLVLFDGATSASYAAFDLSGTLMPGGTTRVGNVGAGDVDLTFADGLLQNGPDAMALYRASAADFPAGTGATLDGLVSSIVYVSDDDVYGASKSAALAGGEATFVEQMQALAGLANRPARVELAPSFPNPARGATTIRFALPDAGPVTLDVYDLLGRRVASLVDGAQTPGWHDVQWDASTLPSGTYFVRLTVGATTQTQRLTVLR